MYGLPDSEIWESFRKGHQEAFAVIYNKYSKDLFAYGYKLCKNKEIVRDASHDLYVELWKNKESLGTTDNIKFYLFKSLRRDIIRILNKNKKMIYDSDENTFEFEVIRSYESEIISQQNEEELHRQLKSAIAKLPSRTKEIMYLKFFEGLTYDEIAELTSINYQSVANTIHRAIKGIRGNIDFSLTTLLLLLTEVEFLFPL